jgi:hypothetical protein
MSLIDWSDPEEMLGLLAEYVADERLAERDGRRTRFLNELSSALSALASQQLSTRATIDRLREMQDGQPAEFSADPTLVHLDDCVQELERIAAQEGGT